MVVEKNNLSLLVWYPIRMAGADINREAEKAERGDTSFKMMCPEVTQKLSAPVIKASSY